MKKVLMLGGSHFQVPAIKMAVDMGFYTISCDYLPDNPGHKFAHEYHNVSTTDKEAVLELAKKLKVDGVVCYSSDPAAPAAAYASEQLGFPTSPYKSVELLSNKDLFREFLKNNGFNTPKAKGYSAEEIEKALCEISMFSLPLVVKPIDSSASKGVTILKDVSKLKEAMEFALSFSRAKRFIIEEFIEKDGYQMGGDGFSVDGKLVFRCFGNSHSYPSNPILHFGESFPYVKPYEIQDKIHNEIQRLLTLLEMKTGAYNFEVRLNKNEDIYFLEVGARNGGAFYPQLIKYATGVDLMEYTIKAAMGMDCSDLKMAEAKGFWALYLVSSTENGIFKEIWMEENFKKNNFVDFYEACKPGEQIEATANLGKSLGSMIMKFASQEEMTQKMDNIREWVKVVLENTK